MVDLQNKIFWDQIITIKRASYNLIFSCILLTFSAIIVERYHITWQSGRLCCVFNSGIKLKLPQRNQNGGKLCNWMPKKKKKTNLLVSIFSLSLCLSYINKYSFQVFVWFLYYFLVAESKYKILFYLSRSIPPAYSEWDSIHSLTDTTDW